jgi:hypothetical protein
MPGPPASLDQVKQKLGGCLNDGVVVLTRHFREELANDDLSMQDVMDVCRSGAILRPPEQDPRTGDWKYRIEGMTAEGTRVAVVFTIRSGNETVEAVLITVFRTDK